MLERLRFLPKAIAASEVIHVVVLRVFLAVLALIAMRLTFSALPELHFVAFVNILFGLSLASAGLSALKRNFWVNFSPDAVGVAILGGSLLSVFITLVTASITAFVASDLPFGVLLAAVGAASLMAAARNVERFTYGFHIMGKDTFTAFRFGIAFALSEIAVVLFMLTLDIENLALRFGLPSLIFFIFFVFSGGFPQIYNYINKCERLWSVNNFIGDAITILFNGTGILSLILAFCMISAGMLDRLLLGAMCQSGAPFDCSTASAMLLVFTYGVAFQTVMNSVLDWLKPRVYNNGEWVKNAKSNLKQAFIIVVSLGITLPLLSWPIAKALTLAPPEIDFWLWVVIFARFNLFVVILLFQVDLWMSRSFAWAIPVWCLIIVSILLAYLIGAKTMSFFQLQSVIIAIVALGAAREGWALTRRLSLS